MEDKQGSEAKAHPTVTVEFSETHQVYPEMSFFPKTSVEETEILVLVLFNYDCGQLVNVWL